MPRKKLYYDLPALRRPAAARGRELADAHLVEILRKLALTHRGAETQDFYPLRNAAKDLQVPISAISRAYGKLKKEGLLATMRGSRTVLQGRRAGRRLHIKSFIGLPVSYSCFMTLQDYRRFYLELKREAQLRGFGCNLLFYEDNPRGLEGLCGMLDDSGVDSIIWFLPRISVRDTVLRLRDNGIPVLGVSDGGTPGIACRYEVHREKALIAILRHWRSDAGLSSVTVVRGSERSPADEEMIEHAAEKAGLPSTYKRIREDGIVDGVASLCEDPRVGVILPATPAALISLRAPQAFGRLLQKCRVALPDGPVTTVLGALPDAPVDLITVNWRSVSKRIVGDIARKRAFKESRPTVFEATPRYRAALHRYAEIV